MNKFYIQTPASELPTKDGEYFTDQGELRFSNGKFWVFTPEWWLKEADQAEEKREAIEFAEWIGRMILRDSWFKPEGRGKWYKYLHGHITTEDLYKLFKNKK